MDVTLSAEQRAWQLKARAFALEDIRPISLERDQMPGARETFDWDIIRKGSRLGFRTGDIIVQVGREKIDTIRDLEAQLKERPRVWQVVVKRGNQLLQLQLSG